MRKKKLLKIIYFQIIPIFLIGFLLGIISIWPGIISTKSRKCFFNILKDGSDGNVRLNTMLSINPGYLVKIKNNKNTYIKILLIGDSCFRKIWFLNFIFKLEITLYFLYQRTIQSSHPKPKRDLREYNLLNLYSS